MADQTENCACGDIKATLCIRVKADVDTTGDGSAGETPGVRTWESEWFPITPNATLNFTHNLGIEEPWLCTPIIALQALTQTGGWQPGDIIFANGANYNGATAHTEIGWITTLGENTCDIVFGNSADLIALKKTGGFLSQPKNYFQGKLVIRY